MDTNKKFTPEEVAASLLKCASPVPCEGCISIEHRGDCDCADWLKRTAADLIGELAAEVARLRGELILKNNELLKLREENRWIPTSERLPEAPEGASALPEGTDDPLEYAVIMSDTYLVMIEGAKKSTTLYFDGEDFFDYVAGELIPYTVTHWKPMPKGPEKKGGCDHEAKT